MTHAEALQRNADLRAIGREPVATFHARHLAERYVWQHGGEILPGPTGLDVFAYVKASETNAAFEAMRLFAPAPTQTRGQMYF